MHELVIYPLVGVDGESGLYRVERDGVVICGSTREPLLAGSRVLLAAGVDPKDLVGIRREGSPEIDLSSRVGVAARWTVREDDRRGPEFRRYEERPFVRGAPPRSFSGSGSLSTAHSPKRIPSPSPDINTGLPGADSSSIYADGYWGV